MSRHDDRARAPETQAGWPACLDWDPPDWLLNDGDIGMIPEPEFIVPGLLQTASLLLIFGPPGSGKSTLAMALAGSLSTGLPFLDRPVLSTAPAIYMAFENPNSFRVRHGAWKTANGLAGVAVDVYGVVDSGPTVLDFLRPHSMYRFAEKLRGLAPGLIVVDTYSRAATGSDEGTAATSTFLASCCALRDELGAVVAVLHHPCKSDETRERGGGGLLGGFDISWNLVKSAGGLRTLTVNKARDFEEGATVNLQLVPVAGTTGATVTVVDSITRTGSPLVDVLRVAGGQLTGTEWREAAGMKKPTFHRAVKALVESGQVVRTPGKGGLYLVKGRETTEA
jgi:hypothetical protein